MKEKKTKGRENFEKKAQFSGITEHLTFQILCRLQSPKWSSRFKEDFYLENTKEELLPSTKEEEEEEEEETRIRYLSLT